MSKKTNALVGRWYLWWRRLFVGDVGGGGASVWRLWWRRWVVEARVIGDRVDRLMRFIFGLGRKSPPEKFSGGGEVLVLDSKNLARGLSVNLGCFGLSLVSAICNIRSLITDEAKGWELHNLLDKVVSVGTAPGPNSSDHNVNTITNGDGILHSLVERCGGDDGEVVVMGAWWMWCCSAAWEGLWCVVGVVVLAGLERMCAKEEDCIRVGERGSMVGRYVEEWRVVVIDEEGERAVVG
ncbi:hypothetical protein Tco_1082583 [Tanacetum coccineum]|uniref:Uncharacterized protein n=1 Tax=Tanacetum coccineum TaxID=301880 RepID=A0ABQ5I0U5_9ASTR